MDIRRWAVINRLIEQLDYRSYLEIGVATGATFKRARIANKIGVDPRWRLWYFFRRDVKKMTSDKFFARNRRSFDLIFIDGLHVADQVYRDIQSSLACLNDGGTIVVHDCLPASKEQQAVPRSQSAWTGNGWRALLKVSQDPDLHVFVFAVNTGCGVIRREPRPAGAPFPPEEIDPLSDSLPWEDFQENRRRWLQIYAQDEVMEVIDRLASRGQET